MKWLTALTRRNRVRLVALLLRRRIKEVPATGQKQNEAFRILTLQKGGFNQDIESALASRPEVRLFSAPRTDFQAFFSAFVPDTVRDYSYIGHPPEVEAAKLRYRDFLNRLWTELEQRGVRFDAVVSGNHVYYAERELAAMLEERGTPFVVAHKEGLKTSAHIDFYINQYRTGVGRFNGRRMLVYNETEKDIQLRSGIVTPDRIEIVGMARLDRCHAWRLANTGVTPRPARRMIFFWFDSTTGIHQLQVLMSATGRQEGWPELWRLVMAQLGPLAERHPQMELLIKAKGMAKGNAEIRRKLSGFGPLPPNIEIIVGGDPFEQILTSDFAVGLHSTALFEAMAAGKPVLVPRFAEAAKPEMREFLLDFGDAVDYADSPDDFVRKLDSLTTGWSGAKIWNPARAALLMKWYGNPDGRSGERLWRGLLKELDRTRHPQYEDSSSL